MRSEKPWGYEEILERNGRYMLKRIFMKKNHRCSLQKHEKKTETIYMLQGQIILHEGKINIPLSSDDYHTIIPLTEHRMTAIVDSDYLEASTPELEDVVRLKDDYGRAT